jgi:copper chaperone NosL
MKIHIISKIMLMLAAMMLVAAVQLPIWRIELDAPQYPEGLRLLIFADQIGGDVEIINGLNHYIGMKTLHTEDFFEFSILKPILYGFSCFALLVMLIGKRKWLYYLLALFVIFGIAAMVDFWRWEYNYGHNLDPNAAIIVPGMSYQPPLIGFKQLLNFGAYSIPDSGGWLLLGSGVFMLITVISESGIFNRRQKKNTPIYTAIIITFLAAGCGAPTSRPIQVNRDVCANCKMTISDLRFSAEAVSKTNKVYTFDDVQCLLFYAQQNSKLLETLFFVADFEQQTVLLKAQDAWYVTGGKLSSPMGGNMAAFREKMKAEKFSAEQGGSVSSWGQIKKP